jgi:hypothetical protein
VKPKIGVVIPCYKTWEKFELYLQAAIDAALPFADFKMFREYGDYVSHVDDAGVPRDCLAMAKLVGDLRNRGIDKALADGCDYIFITDDDNLIPADYFTTMLMFDLEPVKTSAGVGQVRPDEPYLDFGFRSINSAGGQTRVEGLAWFTHVDFGNSNLFIRADVFAKVERPFYGGVNEDYGFADRLNKAGYKPFVAPIVTVEYR